MINTRSYLSDLKRKYLLYRRSRYFNKIESLIKSKPSIISNNCFAGRIYQDLDLEYNSPTAGLYIFYPDYIKFLSNLEENLNSEIVFVKESKYDLGNERIAKAKHKYPVGILNKDIEIHFLHYENEAEAYEKWARRSKRVDLNNLVVFGAEMDLCSVDDVKAFSNLDFNHKYFFSANKYDLKNVYQIEMFEKQGFIGDPYRYGHVLYKALASNIK
jgi:uncharacterized protein (DUF1919 family)